MTALAQDGAINEDSLSHSELDRIYGPLREQVTDSIHRQETVLANIQVQQLRESFTRPVFLSFHPPQKKKKNGER